MATKESKAAPVVGREWVDCPVCGESDMRKETDGEGNSLVFCVNHSCASNGGLNHSAIAIEPSPALVPEGYEVVNSNLLNSAKVVVLTSAKLLNTMDDLTKAKLDMDAADGSNATVFLLAGDKIAAEEKLSEYSSALLSALFDYRKETKTLTLRSTAVPSDTPSAIDAKLSKLARDFIKDCIRKKGRTVSGDDLAASATRLLERLDAPAGSSSPV
jgi:hypothetical protein